MMLGPFSIDLYLPIIPVIANDLQGDARQVSFALSLYMFGFALGHLLWGGLSDSIGRLCILYPGLIGYILLNIFASMSQQVSHLMLIRGLQGLAGAAVVTVIPALVHDCFETKKCARILSLILFQLMALVPLVVIVMSGVIVPLLGWRSVFLLLAGLGSLALILVRYHFVETLPAEERIPLALGDVMQRYMSVFKHNSVMGFLVVQSLIVAGVLSFLVMSPVIYIYEYNIPVQHYGVLYAISVSFGAVCCFINSRLVQHFPLEWLISCGLIGGVLTSIGLLGMFFFASVSLVDIVVCTALYYGSFALIGPNANTLAFSKLPFSTGTVNSVGGLLRFSIGGLLTGACAWLSLNPVSALAWTMLFCSVSASLVLCFIILQQRKKQNKLSIEITCIEDSNTVHNDIVSTNNNEVETLPKAAA